MKFYRTVSQSVVTILVRAVAEKSIKGAAVDSAVPTGLVLTIDLF
ncbi:MAG TPA: hypothetical protein VN379_17650 [Sporomusa sp.]|nr:hypothetical protein [Sporomusa sp.]